MTRSIKDQTGWSGPLPVSMLQDDGILLRIKEYSYQLNNDAFMSFFKTHSFFNLPADPKAIGFIYKHDLGKSAFFEAFRTVGQYGGQPGRILDDDELGTKWRVLCILRGKTQNLWEIFNLLKSEGSL